MHPDEKFLSRCLTLAAKGKGHVSPNPLVGCVIVKDGKIIAEGYHHSFGGPHAEIDAFSNAKTDVTGATLYVNLEPCSHYGKTPPCADTLIGKKIARVVIGTKDPNPLVAGKGIAKLRAAGIEVTCGILQDSCFELNRFFFKYIGTGLPYVTLKAGQSLDGRIATASSDSKWITSVESRTQVHRMRAEYDAVLIGPGTALADDPELTVRMVKGRNPKRIVIDPKLFLPLSLKLFMENPEKNVFLVTTKTSIKENPGKAEELIKAGIHLVPLAAGKNGRQNPLAILKALGKLKIASVLVEGGSGIYTSFMRANAVDELCLFISPRLLGNGMAVLGDLGRKKVSQAPLWQIRSYESSGSDIKIVLRK